MKFEPIKTFNDDAQRVDIHDDPPGLWHRVVCVSGWQSAKIARKRWPHAAAVGPLRTVEGIDLLVRSLLANPQVRLVIIDGPTAGPIGERTFAALRALWADPIHASWVQFGEGDLHDNAEALCYVRIFDLAAPAYTGEVIENNCVFLDFHDGKTPVPIAVADADRPGGRVVLPPPPPKVTTAAPHGDPGQRVVGRTLADVWPRALEVAMRFGRTVPTHYGATREYLGLTSVIRDPLATIAELETPDERTRAVRALDPVLGLTWAEVEAYYRESFTASVSPPGESIHYGPRMSGSPDFEHPHTREEQQRVVEALRVEGRLQPNQFKAIGKLLDEKPDTRVAYLTPWRAAADAGVESGRPCLVGIWFRAVPGRMDPIEDAYITDPPTNVLHAIAAFRSHDLSKGYPLNAAALCLLLRDTAERHGMAVGALTVHSYSAHVYASAWNTAEEVIKANPGPVISWDTRSIAVVEVYETDTSVALRCQAKAGEDPATYAILCGQPAIGLLRRFPTSAQPGEPYCTEHEGPGRSGPVFDRAPLPKVKEIRVIFRAACLTPDGEPDAAGPVIGILWGKTASEVALKIKRSGLAQEPGHLLWLGIELAKAEAKL